MKDTRSYRIDGEYKDARDIAAENQFVRWLRIRNAGGIRGMMVPTAKRRGDVSDIAALILVSRQVGGSGYNPWQNVVDRHTGRIWYWGDAKAHATKKREDFLGNQRLIAIWEAVNRGRFADVPPILHFSKPEKGVVKFDGLCVLADLEEAWIEDAGRRVRNYRAVLDILPVMDLRPAWLEDRRARRHSPDVPPEWADYAESGAYRPLRAWVDQIRSRASQLPASGSPDWSRLERLSQIPADAFEGRVVKLFQRLPVAHTIERTRYSQDGGFDFQGSFRLPPPLTHSVAVKGEAKRYALTNGVGTRHVSRLVARLQRGEHGLFVTTSYFSRQCQEEVLADRYPVELIAGGQLLAMFDQLGMGA